MKVKFKKLHPDAKLPTYAHPGDAGLDLYAISCKPVSDTIKTNNRAVTGTRFKYLEYSTGLAIHLEPGYVGLLFPRSSISETSMNLRNCVGVVDSGYSGEITFRFTTIDNGLRAYEIGDRIGQLLILPVGVYETEWTEEERETKRGHGGYGSSGA